jgi:uncharacterized protein
MLSFDIRALEAHAEPVDGELLPTDEVWQEGDPLPLGPIRVTGRLSGAGPDRFYFSGRITGTAQGECRRCLADVTTPVALDSHLVFTSSEGEDADDESDAYVFDAGERELDVREAVREEWLLHVPAFPLCREDCAGLCPRCGADRNLPADAGGCRCEPERDARWEALRAAAAGGSTTEHAHHPQQQHTHQTHDAAPGTGTSAE